MSKESTRADRGFSSSHTGSPPCVRSRSRADRSFGDAPIAIAANRDEALNRPSEPPALREAGRGDGDDDGSYVAPRRRGRRDVDRALRVGVVAAVTNRWLADRPRATGPAVCSSATVWRPTPREAAVRTVERDLETRSYDGFNLVLADDAAAFLLSYDGRLAITRLDPGVHVVGNVGGVVNGVERFAIPDRRREFGTERADSARAVAAALVPKPGESGVEWLDRASETLADHEYGACLHGDDFGTRSFTRIRTAPDFEPASEFAYADGPPCETLALSRFRCRRGSDRADRADWADRMDRRSDGDGAESQF